MEVNEQSLKSGFTFRILESRVCLLLLYSIHQDNQPTSFQGLLFFLIHLPSLGRNIRITGSSTVLFYMGSRDLNLGPQTCAESALPNESCSQDPQTSF